jgi:chromosome segregation ATPase
MEHTNFQSTEVRSSDNPQQEYAGEGLWDVVDLCHQQFEFIRQRHDSECESVMHEMEVTKRLHTVAAKNLDDEFEYNRLSKLDKAQHLIQERVLQQQLETMGADFIKLSEMYTDENARLIEARVLNETLMRENADSRRNFLSMETAQRDLRYQQETAILKLSTDNELLKAKLSNFSLTSDEVSMLRFKLNQLQSNLEYAKEESLRNSRAHTQLQSKMLEYEKMTSDEVTKYGVIIEDLRREIRTNDEIAQERQRSSTAMQSQIWELESELSVLRAACINLEALGGLSSQQYSELLSENSKFRAEIGKLSRINSELKSLYGFQKNLVEELRQEVALLSVPVVARGHEDVRVEQINVAETVCTNCADLIRARELLQESIQELTVSNEQLGEDLARSNVSFASLRTELGGVKKEFDVLVADAAKWKINFRSQADHFSHVELELRNYCKKLGEEKASAVQAERQQSAARLLLSQKMVCEVGTNYADFLDRYLSSLLETIY